MQRIQRMCLALLLSGSLALSGCAEAPEAPPPAAAGGSEPAPAGPEDLARAAVATRLNLSAADVQLISSTARDFADASLDCPEPDMSYAQVITPGHQVILEADGRRFDVRVAGGSAKICHRRKGGPQPRIRGQDNAVSDLAEQARQDLARRLGTAPTSVEIAGMRALRAEDVLTGCRIECAPGTTTCGYAIGLLHAGRRFDYLAQAGRISPCPPILRS